MKHQTPITKHQRNSKQGTAAKAAPSPNGHFPVAEYSSVELSRWELNEFPASDHRHPFDLEERTACFGESIVRFSKKIPRNPTNNRLIDQLVGCGTSVGGNYCEADESVSKKDFRFVIARCKKEAKETKFFLRMIAASEPSLADEARPLFREAKELHLIFSSIHRNSK